MYNNGKARKWIQMELRWKQRYENYCKAVSQLDKFIEKKELNPLEVQGLIQCFEYTFELAWKTMKDFLEEHGQEVKSPRESIQLAFANDLIRDGHSWIDALNKRNLMSHTYDEANAEEARHLIVDIYYDRIIEFKNRMENIE